MIDRKNHYARYCELMALAASSAPVHKKAIDFYIIRHLLNSPFHVFQQQQGRFLAHWHFTHLLSYSQIVFPQPFPALWKLEHAAHIVGSENFL